MILPHKFAVFGILCLSLVVDEASTQNIPTDLQLKGYFDWIMPVDINISGENNSLLGSLTFPDQDQKFDLEGRRDGEIMHLYEIMGEMISGHLRIEKKESFYLGTWTNANFTIQYPMILYEASSVPPLQDFYFGANYVGKLENKPIHISMLSMGTSVQGCITLNNIRKCFDEHLSTSDGFNFFIQSAGIPSLDSIRVSFDRKGHTIRLISEPDGQAADIILTQKTRLPLAFDSNSQFHKFYQSVFLPFSGFNPYPWFRKGNLKRYEKHHSNRLTHQSNMWPKLIWLDENIFSASYILFDSEWDEDSTIVVNVQLGETLAPINLDDQFKGKTDILTFCKRYVLDQTKSSSTDNRRNTERNIRRFKYLAVRHDGLIMMTEHDFLKGQEITLIPSTAVLEILKKSSLLFKIWDLN